MAKNIEMNYYNGSTYEALYPKTQYSNIIGTPTLSYSNISGTVPTTDLPTIPVSKGGTGTTSATSLCLIYASTSSMYNSLARPSTLSYLQQSNTGAPKWASIAKLKEDLGMDEGKMAVIAQGSYIGTGTYGSDNRSGISVDFRPRLVFILRNGLSQGLTFFCRDTSSTYVNNDGYYSNGNSTSRLYVMYNLGGVYWYSTEDEDAQMNESGVTYYYRMIG